MDPLTQVSVIIPAFNAEKFIYSTLKTVAYQTILPLEVIVIDDGSSDGSCAVVEKFARENSFLNLRLIMDKHKGPGAARNKGISEAKGTWIAFLDSDDFWEPTKLECMAICSNLTPSANFLCHNEIHNRLNKSPIVNDYSKNYDPAKSLNEQLYLNNLFSTSAIIIRKELIVSNGGFNISLQSAQDYELWLRLSNDLKVLFVNKVLGTYNDRVGNISSTKSFRRFLNYHRVLYIHRKKVRRIIRYKVVIRSIFAIFYRILT